VTKITLEQLELSVNEKTHVGARYQTLQRSFEGICKEDSPWIPLGKFMHQFFGEYKEYREKLIHDPIILPEHISPKLHPPSTFVQNTISTVLSGP